MICEKLKKNEISYNTKKKTSQKTISFCGATLLNNGLINIRLFKTWEVFKKNENIFTLETMMYLRN